MELTPRWTPMRDHDEQIRLIRSKARFKVVPAGRRSGKTEIVGKRKLVLKALFAHRKDLPQYYIPYPDPRLFCAAPTRDQVKRIYWHDLKALIPKEFLLGNPNESQLILSLINGVEIHCLGMDKPERAEGTPWDYGVLDEYANMKARTWTQHIRPALSDRLGGCDFIGVPEGRNHYYDLYRDAQAQALHAMKNGLEPEWDAFHWISADILPEGEIIAAKRDLDELTYQQEYEASFVNFTGRAYYNFTEQTHCASLTYNPKEDLLFMFDFNVAPGIAVIGQEQYMPKRQTNKRLWGTGIIGEVWIPRGSNTIRVCDKLIQDWGKHKGRIFCYGDSTGGSKGSAKVLGSDWQLVKEKLWSHFGMDRLFFRVPLSNPRERDRVNTVNSRLLNIKKEIRMMVDPTKAPQTVRDFEGVVVIEGGSGEIDKSIDPERTHLSDAIGYHLWQEYPVKKQYDQDVGKYWK